MTRSDCYLRLRWRGLPSSYMLVNSILLNAVYLRLVLVESQEKRVINYIIYRVGHLTIIIILEEAMSN